MKKVIKISLVIVLLIIAGAWIWWEKHKKGIIKNSIENAVTKGTDSLYFISYDSSSFDELNGNAIFYNVNLQSDSLQKQLLQFDTTSSESIYNIHIDIVKALGVNIPALLNNKKVEARSIQLIRPVVYIIKPYKAKPEKEDVFNNKAIYERILGRYESIKAGEIVVDDGYVTFMNSKGEPKTRLKNISVQLNNFRVDSTKDYNNIVSYFIKDVIAKVKELSFSTDHHLVTFSGIEYNARERFISIQRFLETDTVGKPVFDINNSLISGISTDSFILKQQIKADEFKCEGGLVTVFTKKNQNSSNDYIEFDNDAFEEAVLNKVSIFDTKLVIYNRNEPAASPFIIDKVRFFANDIQKVSSGTNFKDIINQSNWSISAEGFSFLSKDKIYKFNVGNIDLDNLHATMRIKSFSITPQVSEQAFVKSLKSQKDLYNIQFNNIIVNGLDTKELISKKKIIAEAVSLQPTLKIFNDRTVPIDPKTPRRLYPQQQLQAIEIPFYIKKLIVSSGGIFYKERGALSKQTGVVHFKEVNGIVTNVTNIPEFINKNPDLELNAKGKFMGVSKLNTNWKLPLNKSDGSFKVSGAATGFNAESLNQIVEPLGMASIKKGEVKSLKFEMNGDNLKSSGTTTLVYDNLKLELLKMDSTEQKKKDFMSFVTNALVKNSNAENDNIKPVKMTFERDTTKSFFNLVWKTIFEGAKNTIQKL